ncbi:RNA polymerase ECF-type sigma factor [Planctomycetales bacterium 10988]|nr:RNA polymerase ECF-type sigma factor [Planctomycetales bacterium 10988]
MNQAEKTEQFVQQLAKHQNRLYGYIFSLLGDHARTADVVQETNLVLWRKIDEYQPTKPFIPWAFAIAHFQVLAHLRDAKRDRVLLDEDLAETLSREAQQKVNSLDSVTESLRNCLQKLAPHSSELIQKRYFQGNSILQIAKELDRSVGSLKVALLRIRRQLAECVQQNLAEEGES